MPKTIKTNPPPETKILSVESREVTDPSQTSSNLGLADPSQAVAEETPGEALEQELETVDQPFTTDEGGEPLPPGPSGDEPTGDEPTSDPLKDTQRAYHKVTEELAKTKKVLNFMVANAQMGGGQAPAIAPVELSPEPTEEERLDPTLYTKRMMAAQEHKNTILEMQNFTDNHSDWMDLMPTMEEISNEEAVGTFQKPGGISRLYKRAKDREELLGYRTAMKDSADIALQAGANMQRKKGGSAFVSPSGGGGGRSRSAMPADFAKWDTGKQLQWLKDHGLYKEDTF